MPVRNFEVYEGGRMIYQSRDGIHERKWSRSNLRAYFIHIVPKLQYIYIHIRADRIFYTQDWGIIKIGDQAAYIREIIQDNLLDFLLSYILFFIAVCLLMMQIITRKEYLPFTGIGLYALCFSIAFNSGLVINQLIWHEPIIRYYSDAVFYYVNIIGIILFVGTFTDPDKKFRQIKPIFKGMILAVVIHALLMTVLDITGVISIYATYNYFSIFLIVATPFLIVSVIQEGIHLNIDMKLVMWGGICSGLTAMHDLIGMTTGFLLLGRYVMDWGMLLLVIFMILFMVKRFINVNQELTDLNTNLEERVLKRTEELEDTNMELGELNEELNVTIQSLQRDGLKNLFNRKKWRYLATWWPELPMRLILR